MRKYIILYASFLIFFISCGKNNSNYRYLCYYNVINSTNTPLKVYYTGLKNTYNYPEPNDSIAYVMPGEKKSLFVVLTPDQKIPEPGESLHVLDFIQVYQYDTIPSNKSLTATKFWHYGIIADDASELNLEIDQEDFN